MSTTSHRVVRHVRYEFFAPIPVDRKDMAVMERWATDKFKEVKGREVTYDDDIWTTHDDENIIMYFEVETPT